MTKTFKTKIDAEESKNLITEKNNNEKMNCFIKQEEKIRKSFINILFNSKFSNYAYRYKNCIVLSKTICNQLGINNDNYKYLLKYSYIGFLNNLLQSHHYKFLYTYFMKGWIEKEYEQMLKYNFGSTEYQRSVRRLRKICIKQDLNYQTGLSNFNKYYDYISKAYMMGKAFYSYKFLIKYFDYNTNENNYDKGISDHIMNILKEDFEYQEEEFFNVYADEDKYNDPKLLVKPIYKSSYQKISEEERKIPLLTYVSTNLFSDPYDKK